MHCLVGVAMDQMAGQRGCHGQPSLVAKPKHKMYCYLDYLAFPFAVGLPLTALRQSFHALLPAAAAATGQIGYVLLQQRQLAPLLQ